MPNPASGHCLCGAVQVQVRDLPTTMSACHCDLCTRWTGSLHMGLEVPAEACTITGPVRTYRSSDFAERGWCDTCGSAVFFRNIAGRDAGLFELYPGLFADAGGARLTRVVYADRAPAGVVLGGDLDRVTKVDYEATCDHVEDAP